MTVVMCSVSQSEGHGCKGSERESSRCAEEERQWRSWRARRCVAQTRIGIAFFTTIEPRVCRAVLGVGVMSTNAADIGAQALDSHFMAAQHMLRRSRVRRPERDRHFVRLVRVLMRRRRLHHGYSH